MPPCAHDGRAPRSSPGSARGSAAPSPAGCSTTAGPSSGCRGASRSPPAPGLDWRAVDLAARGRPDGSPVVAAAVADLPAVDALVHAAGFQESGPLRELDPAASERMHAVHVGAAVRLASCLEDRLADGGRILLIGSRTAEGAWGKSQYAATKAALGALGRSWALELAPPGYHRERAGAGPHRDGDDHRPAPCGDATTDTRRWGVSSGPTRSRPTPRSCSRTPARW